MILINMRRRFTLKKNKEIPTNVILFEYLLEKEENIKLNGTNIFNVPIMSFYKNSGQGIIKCLGNITSINKKIFNVGYENIISLIIPNSVNFIVDYAFQNYSSLTSITIPNSVTSIGKFAFDRCTSLTSITIPNSVTSIGEFAFSNCKSLTSITIPDSVTSIGRYAFNGCNSLISVYLTSTIPPDLEWVSINGVFEDNASGLKFYVPQGSINAYKTAPDWKYYANVIVEYNF